MFGKIIWPEKMKHKCVLLPSSPYKYRFLYLRHRVVFVSEQGNPQNSLDILKKIIHCTKIFIMLKVLLPNSIFGAFIGKFAVFNCECLFSDK